MNDRIEYCHSNCWKLVQIGSNFIAQMGEYCSKLDQTFKTPLGFWCKLVLYVEFEPLSKTRYNFKAYSPYKKDRLLKNFNFLC